MTLIIEDGTGTNPDANTYVNDAEYVAYALARGRTIGSDATVREKELILAMDYIESHRAQFQGRKLLSAQPVQFPRTPVYIDGFLISSSTITNELKNAEMEAAAIINDESLLKTGATNNLQSEEIDGMDVSYFNGGSWDSVRTDTVDIFLRPLLNFGSFGISAKVRRG